MNNTLKNPPIRQERAHDLHPSLHKQLSGGTGIQSTGSLGWLQTWFERTLRMGLITILLAAIFQGPAHSVGHSSLTVYNTLLRLACCATLFAAGMVLKTLAAKMLSSHFNKASYFDKMQDALRKVGSAPFLEATGMGRKSGMLASLEAYMHARKLRCMMDSEVERGRSDLNA